MERPLPLLGPDEPDRAFRRRRRVQEILQDVQDGLQVDIVLADLALQRLDLPRQILVGGQHLTQMHKSTDHLNARSNRDRTA